MYIVDTNNNSMYAKAKKVKSLQLEWKVAKEAMRDAKAENYDTILSFSLWQLILWKLKRNITNLKRKCQTN